jgi:hypothetical protein
MRPNVNRHEDTGILGIKVSDRVIQWLLYISLILLHLTYIYKISVNNDDILWSNHCAN